MVNVLQNCFHTKFYSIALLLNYYICVVGLCMARRMSTHKERQARASVKPGKMYGVSNCCESQGFFKRICCIWGYHHVYRKVCKAGGGEVLCVRENLKALLIDMLYRIKELWETICSKLLCVLLFIAKIFPAINVHSLTSLQNFFSNKDFPIF